MLGDRSSYLTSYRFRWAFCQLEVLRHCIPASIQQTLDQLPETLDETYARVLRQIPQASQAHAHRMLQCLVVAVRPLRVEELAEVLAFEFDTAEGAVPRYRADWRPNDQVQTVLSTCSSLIAIVDDHGSQVVQFSHFSVKEFLMSDRLTSSLGDLSRYRILPGPAHTILAQACLGFLLHFGNRVGEESVKDFPLAQYAARYWVTHAQFENVASRVKDGMKSLFDCDKPHFAAWVGTYNIDEPLYRNLHSKIPTPLYYSSLCGFSDMVEHLATKRREDVNAIGGRYEFPLLAALHGKHTQVAEILLKHRANVDIRGTGRRQPIPFTDVDMLQFLLKHGADVNFQQDDFGTPLHLAVYHRRPEVARVLLEHKADINSQNNSGTTPLYMLLKHAHESDFGQLSRLESLDFDDMFQLLLEHGADVNCRGDDLRTPLHLAISYRHLNVARVLLEHKAYANSRDNSGETPLYKLIQGARSLGRIADWRVKISWHDHDIKLARLLLRHGADVNIRTKNEWTPLHLATFKGHLELARLLLDHCANVNTANEKGETPLHLVSRGNDIEGDDFVIAVLLLKRGADPNVRDNHYATPFQLARNSGKDNIASVMLEYGARRLTQNDQDLVPSHLSSEEAFLRRGKFRYDLTKHV
jgi:ankyrin repeat protein